jgi:hypothetical protein
MNAARPSVPPWLKPSAAIDIAHLWFRIRPALRTELARSVSQADVHRWAHHLGFFSALDDEGFLSVSRDPQLSRRIIDLDRQSGNHTFALGLRLGYPRCCCRMAARIGEIGLDAWEHEPTEFRGRFKLINPTGYRRGNALISHIPCSPHCQPSLRMAEALLLSLRHIKSPIAIRLMHASWHPADLIWVSGLSR